MSDQRDDEPTVAFFVERERALLTAIEGAKYDLGKHVEALREVVADLKVGKIDDALELLEHEIASAEALIVALSAGDEG